MQIPSTRTLMTELARNPAGWPEELLPVFQHAVTVEFASLTRSGSPVTFPLTPYIGEDARTLDVSTGLTYPAKAERARRNPRVALLYADPLGSGISDFPVVLVQGLATVRDSDPQRNTDRYVQLSMSKLPMAYKGQPKFLLRKLPWYFARVWISVTPTRILWWPGGRLDEQPQEWTAPEGTEAPPSDPAPPGKPPAAWAEEPGDWDPATSGKLDFPNCDLTFVGADGFPYCFPVSGVKPDQEGFYLRMPDGVPLTPEGPACLTFHRHTPEFTRQENRAFVGQVSASGAEALFRVERLLGNWSLTGNMLSLSFDLLFRKGRALAPRLQSEAARRGQPIPKVRFPGEY